MTSNRKRVLVPHTMGRAGVEALQARADVDVVPYPADIGQAALHDLLPEADAIALSGTRFGQPELDAAPKLAVVARIGVGYDAVDVPALTARRVPLMVAGTANSTSVAEQAVFFMLALAKRATEMHALVRDGNWTRRHGMLPGEVCGKTALVVGFGRIGTRTAKRCAGLDMQVVVYDPYVPAETIRAAGYEAAPDLDAALGRADFVTIHCPKTPQTVGMFDAARLARMKPGAVLVNTARGGIVDESALYYALTSGRLAGAGLDVFAEEPTSVANPLLKLDNVLASPHMAGVTREAVEAMALATARNMLGVLDGAPVAENVVNREVLAG